MNREDLHAYLKPHEAAKVLELGVRLGKLDLESSQIRAKLRTIKRRAQKRRERNHAGQNGTNGR